MRPSISPQGDLAQLSESVCAVFHRQGRSMPKQAEVVVGPDLEERDSGPPTGQVVVLRGLARVEEAHQVAAVGAGPRTDLEGVEGYPADFVEVAVDAGELETLNQEGVEARLKIRTKAEQLSRHGLLTATLPGRDLLSGSRAAGAIFCRRF